METIRIYQIAVVIACIRYGSWHFFFEFFDFWLESGLAPFVGVTGIVIHLVCRACLGFQLFLEFVLVFGYPLFGVLNLCVVFIKQLLEFACSLLFRIRSQLINACLQTLTQFGLWNLISFSWISWCLHTATLQRLWGHCVEELSIILPLSSIDRLRVKRINDCLSSCSFLGSHPLSVFLQIIRANKISPVDLIKRLRDRGLRRTPSLKRDAESKSWSPNRPSGSLDFVFLTNICARNCQESSSSNCLS